VAGFILILALVYWGLNLGEGPRMVETGSVGGGGSSVVSRHSRPRGRPHRHRRRNKRETVEIRRERVVPVVEREEIDQIVVEEFPRQSRSVSRAPPPRTPSPRILPPRPVYNDEDEIVVMEDPTPPRRRRDSVRSHRTRRSDDRRSVYRDEIYVRDVSRQRSTSRR
jgi:hypothetical protein